MSRFRNRRFRLHVLALFVYALASLWNSRAILEHPATLVTYDPAVGIDGGAGQHSTGVTELIASDFKRGVAQLSYAARTLWGDPRRFFAGWMCFPIGGVELGEHMLADGLLGVPAQAVWGDPVVTFNSVVLLKPVVGATTMYALGYHWTASWAAALVAGFVFGFHPLRLADTAHLSVVGNEWIPAILLAVDLLFTRRQWRYALLLAVVAAIQLLSSMYVLLQCGMVVGTYGMILVWRHRAGLLALLPKLALVAAALATVGTWALGPYLKIAEVWDLPVRPGYYQAPAASFWLGGGYFPGACLLLLAAVGLVDRWLRRGNAAGGDPRLPLAVAGLVVVWYLFPLQVPFTELVVPKLGALLRGYVPGITTIRAPDKVFFGAVVPLAILAAFGVRTLTQWMTNPQRIAAITVLAAACVAEVFVPPVAAWSFGAALPTATYRLRPPDADLAAVRDLPDGPVLDLPGNDHFYWYGKLSGYALLGAYHQRRISSCKASFRTPVQFAVNRMARRLPDAGAAQELWALGFRTLIFHSQDVEHVRRDTERIWAGMTDLSAPVPLVPLADGETIRVARLHADVASWTDVRKLTPAPRLRPPRQAGKFDLQFGVRASSVMFRHPDPIRPTDLIITWKHSGRVVHVQQVRGLLPLALAPGRATDIAVGAHFDGEPGTAYEVTLAIAADPQRILGREEILIIDTDPAAPGGNRGG